MRSAPCHVVLDLGREQLPGARLFHVRIDLSLPGGVIAVNREPREPHSHADASVAVRDAFAAAHRQVEDWQRRHHGES